MDIKSVLTQHSKWLSGDGGEKADLRRADLRRANLFEANLRGANLRGANLRRANLFEANLFEANLRGANLFGANLYEADLRGANLRGADLSGANLSGANLSGANLSGANLSGANLSGADLSGAKNVPYHLESSIVPEVGAFECFKSTRGGVLRLRVESDAKRSNATGRKCRASKVTVLELPKGVDSARSHHDPSFVYELGKTIEIKDFNENRWVECAPGIHFYLTRTEAEAHVA